MGRGILIKYLLISLFLISGIAGCQEDFQKPESAEVYQERLEEVDIADKNLTMPIGVLYVNWEFQKSNLSEITVNLTINEFETDKGVYLQLYESNLNGTHFYWGIQEDMIIFSRWETTDISNIRVAPGGKHEAATYEGNFVSVRKDYKLHKGEYVLTLRFTDLDSFGEWYGAYIKDVSRNEEIWIGSLRFPSDGSDRIEGFGGTWMEVYSGVEKLSEIPSWDVSINSITADGLKPIHARTVYGTSLWGENSIPTGDIRYDPDRDIIRMMLGYDISVRNKEGQLY